MPNAHLHLLKVFNVLLIISIDSYILNKIDVPFLLLGHVTKGEIRIDDQIFGDVSLYKNLYENSLSNKLK